MGVRHSGREAPCPPSFIRSPEAIAEIAVMGRELYRFKGSDKMHDAFTVAPIRLAALVVDALLDVILQLFCCIA